MHLALLLGRVPSATECTRSTLDDDLLLDVLDDHRLTILADDDTPGLGRLRAAGADVHVSDKRHVHMPGGGMVDADEAAARWLATVHAETPVDLVVASPAHPQTGTIRDAVPGVAWSVLAGDGPTGSAVRLGLDVDWLGEHARELWLAASAVGASPTLLSPVPPSSLGLRADGDAYWFGEPPVPKRVPRVHGGLVVVAATGASIADGALLFDRLRPVVDLPRTGTVVVLVGEELPDATSVAPVVADGIPHDEAHRVLVTATGRDTDAQAWLAVADALVLHDTGELAVPSIARRAAEVPTAVLDADGLDERTTATVVDLHHRAPTSRHDPALVVWTSPTRVLAELRTLRSTSHVDAVVLHRPDALAQGQRLRAAVRLQDVDVLVGGRPVPPWGAPDPTCLESSAVALHRRSWQAVEPVLRDATDTADVVVALTATTGAASHRLGLTPLASATETVTPRWHAQSVALRTGPLTDLRLPVTAVEPSEADEDEATATAAGSAGTSGVGLRSWARRARWQERARVALPWSLGLAAAVDADELPEDVVGWARRHRITDRARLALPWKWGLLPRAMEGRW